MIKLIIYKTADVLQAPEDVIAHGVNCVGGFGSGVAGQIAKKYPFIKQKYLEKHNSDGWTLGEIQIIDFDIMHTRTSWDNVIVVNCATQKEYLPRGVCHADYDAIEECMRKVRAYVEPLGYSVAIPKIGAGLAGGDWNEIEKRITKVFDNYDISVYSL